MQPHHPFVPTETDFDKEHLRQINVERDEPSEENVWNQKFNGTLDGPGRNSGTCILKTSNTFSNTSKSYFQVFLV